MEIADEMRELVKEIISSYESRVESVTAITEITNEMLEDFKNKRNEMASKLRETLANGESLRRKDFDNMMKAIVSQGEERENLIKEMLKNFLHEHQQMAASLRENLSNGRPIRTEEFRSMIEGIRTGQLEKKKEVRTLLENYRKEQQILADELRKLLSKGESLRIKDFKDMLQSIREEKRGREKEVSRMLAGFRNEVEEAASAWRELSSKQGGALRWVKPATGKQKIGKPKVRKAPEREAAIERQPAAVEAASKEKAYFVEKEPLLEPKVRKAPEREAAIERQPAAVEAASKEKPHFVEKETLLGKMS